jgi:hypothetical protein
MKKRNIVLSLTLTIALGLGVTAYATNGNALGKGTLGNGACVGMGIGRVTNIRGYDVLTELLKSKGVTDSEITAAQTSGKSLHDLALEKGITIDEIQAFMLKERIASIDEAVAAGKSTAEQGEAAKATITENSANCTLGGGSGCQGNAGSMMGKMKGGMMGGRGNSNFKY